MRPEERISPFGLRNGGCGAIRLLHSTVLLSRISFILVYSTVSNATVEVAVVDMFWQKSEKVCGNPQVLLIRTIGQLTVNAGILQNFANTIYNKDCLLFIRVNPMENGRAVCSHDYLDNIYSKCF